MKPQGLTGACCRLEHLEIAAVAGKRYIQRVGAETAGPRRLARAQVRSSVGFATVEVLVGAVVGFVVGVVVYLVTDNARKPKLTFTPQTGDVATASNGSPYRFLSVLVANERRRFLRYLDRTANYARCYVEIKDAASGTRLLRVNGRWASGAEPFNYLAQAVDLARVVIPQREVIPVGESGFAINIAIKFDGDRHFYVFNNENYGYADDGGPWRMKRHRLEENHVLVEIEVFAEGHRYRSGDLLIQNPNQSVANFAVAARN
jgi:hypothetical protein